MLQGDRGEAGDYVVQGDGLRSAAEPFDAKEQFGGSRIVMNRDVERPSGDADLLRDVMPAGREREPLSHGVGSLSDSASDAGAS